MNPNLKKYKKFKKNSESLFMKNLLLKEEENKTDGESIKVVGNEKLGRSRC